MGSSLKYVRIIPILVLLMACSQDRSQRNPYLQEIGFRVEIDLNLPLYNPLTNPGSPVYISSSGVGIRGVFVMNTGFDVYRVFEATCPNHTPSACSTMQIDGQLARCDCEEFEYSLFTGQQLNRPDDGVQYFDMLEYTARPSGNILTLSN